MGSEEKLHFVIFYYIGSKTTGFPELKFSNLVSLVEVNFSHSFWWAKASLLFLTRLNNACAYGEKWKGLFWFRFFFICIQTTISKTFLLHSFCHLCSHILSTQCNFDTLVFSIIPGCHDSTHSSYKLITPTMLFILENPLCTTQYSLFGRKNHLCDSCRWHTLPVHERK